MKLGFGTVTRSQGLALFFIESVLLKRMMVFKGLTPGDLIFHKESQNIQINALIFR
jgi:hypothetical protein